MATLSAYTRLDRVGRGSYGEVFKVRRHIDGSELVLKEVSMVGIGEQEEREILNETSCMMQLSHPHIIAYVGSFLERGSLHIVMEFASGSDLHCLIRKQTLEGKFLSEERLWKWMIQLTQGLQHAHARRILHRDIKASNVFLDAHDNIKIGDLGLGKILGESRCALSQVGTPIYMSPEMCEGKPYDTKSDVWALGCLMFELASLKPPFQAANQALLARKIINAAPESHVPANYSREIPFIISKLLDKDPRRRPSPDSILNYSAVQIRLERASFQAREADLLAQLEEARRQEARRAIEHASSLQCALQQQQQQMQMHLQQQSGDAVHAELCAERDRLRTAKARGEERERERERERVDWRQQEDNLLERCRVLEGEREKEREEKMAVMQQLQHTFQHKVQHNGEQITEEAPGSEEAHTPGEMLHALSRTGSQTNATPRLIIHTSGGVTGSTSRSRAHEILPAPTPNNLFVSPKGAAPSPFTPGVLTPSRGADRRASLEMSVEKSVERATKVCRFFSPSVSRSIDATILCVCVFPSCIVSY